MDSGGGVLFEQLSHLTAGSSLGRLVVLLDPRLAFGLASRLPQAPELRAITVQFLDDQLEEAPFGHPRATEHVVDGGGADDTAPDPGRDLADRRLPGFQVDGVQAIEEVSNCSLRSRLPLYCPHPLILSSSHD